MIQGIALLVSGVALYALAGSGLSSQLARCANDCTRRRALRLLPLALGGPLALAGAAFGAFYLYHQLTPEDLGLPLSALAVSSVAPVGLLAGGLLLLAAFPPGRHGGGGGGSGPDDLPPPPDPDGPDGWAEFERRFRAYAAAHDARRARVLVG